MSDTEHVEPTDLTSDKVVTKYTTCAEIVNRVLPKVIAAVVDGADVVQICKLGDDLIEEECGKLYKKAKAGEQAVQKGIAFPTSISPNAYCGHVSPLPNDTFSLKAGDMVKIDLGAHIDGYACMVAHTVIIPGGEPNARKNDVLHAAWNVAEAAVRCIQAGKTNTEVTAMMKRVAAEFDCAPLQGVLSHQMKQHIVDGSQTIISKETVDEKVDEFKFAANEVYSLDVIMSTGEGKPRETDMRTTIFKRDNEVTFQLRTTKARQFISEVNKRFPTMPFNLRHVSDETVGKVGITEALRHGLCDPYPILREKEGEFVAQFKYTVLLLPGGTKKVTGIAFTQGDEFKTEKTIKDQEIVDLLNTSLSKKKKKATKTSVEEVTAKVAAM